MKKYSVPVEDLRRLVDPLDGKHWKVRPITVDEVEMAVSAGNLCQISWQEAKEGLPEEFHDIFHVTRIAYLVANPPADNDKHKIMLCMVSYESWLYDGWHRLAAAIVRNDERIAIFINAEDHLMAERLPTAVPVGD